MLNLKNKLYIATFQNNAIEVAKTYNLGIEFNNTCISEALDEKNREKLLSAMKRDFDHVAFPSAIIHGPFTEIHPAAIDHRARSMAMARMEEAYQVCKEFPTKGMVVHSGWMPFIYFKNWQAEKGAAFWQEFMKDKPEDFSIYVENVLEDEPYMMAKMMEQIADPRIKLCLDIGHANAATDEDTPVELWIRELAPYIGHFHLHNNPGTGDTHGDFESGSMDIHRILETIEEVCPPNVTFTIEARDCRGCVLWLQKYGYL